MRRLESRPYAFDELSVAVAMARYAQYRARRPLIGDEFGAAARSHGGTIQ
jgi:hypothetical protein